MAIQPYIKDGSKYCADTRRDGRRIRKLFPRTREGKREAELWVLAQKNSVPSGNASGKRSFAEAFEYYTNRASFVAIGDETKQHYRSRLNQFIEFAARRGKLYLSEFSSTDAEAYGAHVVRTFVGKGRTARLSLASSLFTEEIERDDATISRNPFRRVKKTYGPEKEVQFIEEDMLAKIMAATPERDRVIMLILYTTGMRSKELRFLRKTSVTPTYTRISRTDNFKGKTVASEADIPHAEVTWQAYQWLFDHNPPGEYVLRGKKPAGKTYLWKRMNDLCKKLMQEVPGCPHFSPHSLRRSLSTHLAEKGTPVPTIKNMLRHTSEKITMKYYIGKTTKMMSDAVNTIQSGHLVSTFNETNLQQDK